MIQHSPRTGLLPRIPDRLTCRNALRLGLHGKMTQQVSKTINALQVSHRESFFVSFRTHAGKVELASTIKVTVGLNRKKNSRYRDDNVTLTATLEPFAFFIESSTVLRNSPHGKDRVTTTFCRPCRHTHGSLCPQLPAF